MKKIVSCAVILAILAAILVSAVSADGMILFQDNFNSGELNPADWTIEGTAFTVEQGGPTNSPHLEGWKEAVVQQTSYGDDAPAPRTYGPSFAAKVDAWAYADGGGDSDSHQLKLWWADHFTDSIGLDVDRIVYTVGVDFENRKVFLNAYGQAGASEFFDGDVEVASWNLPDDVKLEMDESEPTVFSLGMRVNGTQIDGFFNDQKVVSFTAPRMGQVKCPILLWNTNCWCGFDNFVVSTPDYNLFNESSAPAPAANTGAATETFIDSHVESKVVEDTDENGNVVTKIVTEVVTEIGTRDAAQTSNGGGGGNASPTGDTAVAVIALMVIAFGAAIVVKKVSSK